MSKRIQYHVTAHGSDWQVKKAGASRSASVHETKKDAIAAGKEAAKSAPLGQLVIHKQDGTIQTEYTYGNDPFPPRG